MDVVYPFELGYGERAPEVKYHPMPALIFEVELIKVNCLIPESEQEVKSHFF